MEGAAHMEQELPRICKVEEGAPLKRLINGMTVGPDDISMEVSRRE